MVQHRNPSRRVHSRPHPILTEVPSNPCDHDHIGAHLYWQNFLLTLATIMVPHRSPTNKRRWLHPRRHPILTEVPQKFLTQCLFLELPSIPLSPKASYTDRSSFWSLRPQWSHIGAKQIQVDENNLINILRQPSGLSHSIVYWQKLL